MESAIDRFLTRNGKSKSLVDYGCGNMPYRTLFLPHVEEYIGCDLPGNELADVHLDGNTTLPFETSSVDIVLSSQVLEHVEMPDGYLDECYRVLADDGLLILSTHGVWRYHPDPRDLWRWTSEGLKRTIEHHNFDILDFRGIMAPASTALQLLQDAMLHRIPGRLTGVFVRFMQFWIRRSDLAYSRDARDTDASVYVVVARKSSCG